MRILVCFLLALLAVAPWSVAQTTTEEEVHRAAALARKGKIDEAIKVLEPVVTSPDASINARVLLGRLLDYDGRPQEAIDVWKQGLKNASEDVPLLEALARLYERQAKDGPLIIHRRGMVTYRPSKGKEEKIESFKKERQKLALATRRSLLLLQPDCFRHRVDVGRLLEAEERFQEALELYSKWAGSEKSSPAFLLGQARVLEQLGRGAEATPIYRRVVAAHPQLDVAWAGLAKRLQVEGSQEDAQDAVRRARFYQWVPDFLDIPFTEESERVFATLAPGEQKTKAEREAATSARRKAIERLIDDPGLPASSAFLTALCYRHADHGELENAMFAALQKRGPDGLYHLRALLERGQSACTLRSAAWALAKMKAPDLLPKLHRLLPNDVRPMWHMNIAGALAELGNPAAVPALIEAMDVERVQEDRGPDFWLGMGAGRLYSRFRATLALGCLGGSEAILALEKGLQNDDLRPVCLAALYRATKKASYVEQIMKLSRDERRGAPGYLHQAYFDAVDPGTWPRIEKAWSAEEK